MPHHDLNGRAVLIQGVVARESGVMAGLVNERTFKVYGPKKGARSSVPVLASYRRETDPSPSRTWPVTSHTEISAVRHGVYNVRKKHASIIRAAVAQAYTSKDMVREAFPVVRRFLPPSERGRRAQRALGEPGEATPWPSKGPCNSGRPPPGRVGIERDAAERRPPLLREMSGEVATGRNGSRSALFPLSPPCLPRWSGGLGST